MPNHYDIDIKCNKCGGYVSTIFAHDKIPDRVGRVCPECKRKAKKRRKVKS
jgi:hypothetical protein